VLICRASVSPDPAGPYLYPVFQKILSKQSDSVGAVVLGVLLIKELRRGQGNLKLDLEACSSGSKALTKDCHHVRCGLGVGVRPFFGCLVLRSKKVQDWFVATSKLL
jgi:hypothetical protein